MDVTHECFPSADRNCSMQSLTIDKMLYFLDLDGRKLCTQISKPNPDDYDVFPSNKLASSYILTT